MVVIIGCGEWYLVKLSGEELALFAYLLDARCFAQQVIDRGLAQNMTLPCGLAM